MTDAHCHIPSEAGGVRELMIGREFLGIHPWDAAAVSDSELRDRIEGMRLMLSSKSAIGVGEIGLDRLREREISESMHKVFVAQLDLAKEIGCPVVLHGAKCWGRVVAEARSRSDRIPAFLFHGFSRSDGLLSDIAAINGFVSVGPSVLNDHAVNYRRLVAKIPLDRLLLETDRTEENLDTCPSIGEVLLMTARLLAISADELERRTDGNAARFIGVECK